MRSRDVSLRPQAFARVGSRSQVWMRSVDQQCRSEVSTRSVGQQCRPEVLLRSVGMKA